ncbi:MAG: hypothetical protein H7A24_12260 [Leptospiraceae bacterium]|nr:hypothetical protein [Leptospiraceae bacterium]
MILVFFCITFSIYSKEKDSSDSSYLDSGLLKILEISASSSVGNTRGGENIGSLVSSLRQSNSILSNEGEIFKDFQESREKGQYTKLSYSHQFTSSAFLGVKLSSNHRYEYDRNTLGNKGSFIQDRTFTKENMVGFRIGYGPLDYLSSSSYEISFGYEESRQKGPYDLFGFKPPRISSGQFTDVTVLKGNGTVDFRSKTYSLLFGGSWTGEYLGFYTLNDFQIINGTYKLNSLSLSNTSTVDQFRPIPTNVSLASLKINNFSGFIYHFELGVVIKILENIGFKIGYFAQIPYINPNKAGGYYIENGVINEAESSNIFTSASSRNLFNTGTNFSLVTKF